MNVIVSNKNQLLLENLGVDIIKEMNGEFEVDEIIATFQNFFYQRMISSNIFISSIQFST